jgi:membrane fusion protein, heavy metal efflux system
MKSPNRNYTTPLLATILVLQPLVGGLHPANAGAGHDHSGASSFQGGVASNGNQPIVVDAQTAQRLGLKIEAVRSQTLDIGLKATGKIETPPDRSVDITAPVKGKIVALLVEPGTVVRQGQTLATMTSAELADLRTSSQEKRAEAQAAFEQAQAELKLARENYTRFQQVSQAEIAQARSSLQAAQAQYDRDRALVNSKSVVKAAQNSYQRQLAIARNEIQQAKIEVSVAQERYNQDRQLAASGALSRRQMLESQSKLAAAQTQLAKANNNPEVLKAEGELQQAEVDLPIREQAESAGKLAEARSSLTKALTQKEVLAAAAELKRAQASLTAAQTKLTLSDRAYQTRLQQLGTTADSRGLVAITAPISGTIADRSATIGQSFQDSGAKLMSIVNDGEVLATANIYEQDLNRVRMGQKVHVRVTSMPDRLFTGTISRVGAVVGESRVVPVQAKLDNMAKMLKPGMSAELEVVTERTTQSVVAIPATAVVEANGRKLVYVENGNKFQGVDVTLGRTTGDLVEVKTGLFTGDRIVSQRGMLLYAQSLRGGGGGDSHDGHGHGHGAESHGDEKEKAATTSNNPLATVPTWVWMVGGGTLATAGTVLLWRKRRSKSGELELAKNDRFNGDEIDTILTGILEEDEEPAAINDGEESIAQLPPAPKSEPDREFILKRLATKIPWK